MQTFQSRNRESFGFYEGIKPFGTAITDEGFNLVIESLLVSTFNEDLSAITKLRFNLVIESLLVSTLPLPVPLLEARPITVSIS